MYRVALVLATTILCLNGVLSFENPNDLPFGTSFLTPDNRAEYTKTEKSDRGQFLKGLYLNADTAAKKEILAEVVPKCYSWWLTDAQRSEIEALHSSGDHTTCKKRIRAFLKEQSEEKRENIESYWEFCEHLWYAAHESHNHHKSHNHLHMAKRHLRPSRHAHTSYDDFATEHLSWLTEDERTEVKKLHEENKEKARDRVLEILDASTGEKKEKGIAQLQAACRELIVQVLGEDAAKELKKLKEGGATNEELGTKVGELLKTVTDEQKKSKALEHKYACAKVYDLKASKKRREVTHHHDLESKLKGEWNWLTTEQKDEVRALKTSGKNDEFLLGKVFEYFKNADDKDTAENGLQTSCGGAILTILGPEKAEELKTFMANGAKPEAYEAKVKELLNSAPKKSLTKNQESCKTVFTSASRRRRHEGHHHKTLEEFLQSHLAWLTEAQKNELLELKKGGKDQADIQAKVMEFYEAATGETKEKATADLKSGCEEVLAHIISPEQLAEIKKLRESGASPNDISAKIGEFAKTITDEEKIKESKKYEANCKKIFGVSARRRRHEDGSHHHHTLEDYLTSHLSWLTPPQKESLRKLAQDGKAKEVIQKQVLEYYDATVGEVREKATADLQAGCRELFTHLIGAEKAGELKKLKESGASNDDLRKKGDELVEGIQDEKKKDEAKFYAVGCRKAFGVTESKRKRHVHSSRHRREHDHEAHSLESLYKTYLSWLTEAQQQKLTELKNEGKSREDLQKEVLKYYDEATASVKETARKQMQDGCRKLLVKVLGQEKADELKKLKESGTPVSELATKTTTWISELTDENLKKSAHEYSVVCNKAFNLE